MIEQRQTNGRNVPLKNVKLQDSILAVRTDAIRKTTVAALIKQCEMTGRVDNLRIAAGWQTGEHTGRCFNDSDLYKIIEGIGWLALEKREQELETKADTWIELIAAAQADDGYLHSYFSVKTPEKRWSDMEKHEMYCGGHLIEAAIAYAIGTGKTALLDIAEKLIAHYLQRFGPGKEHWVTGHQEVEMALFKWAEYRDDASAAEFAHWLLEQRGHGYGRGEIWDDPQWGAAYCQDREPAAALQEAHGHAVRAMYYYSALADAVRVLEETAYRPALDRLWRSVTQEHMYITGGLGCTHVQEGFGEPYQLPNDSAYCETCAAAGLVFWSYRMLLLTPDVKYADVMERALYNGLMAGMGADGQTFFYDNPLEDAGSKQRQPWYYVSCCPTQMVRFLPAVGQYVYSQTDSALWIHLYAANQSAIEFPEGTLYLGISGEYPWDGNVTVTVESVKGLSSPLALYLRQPGWCAGWEVQINGADSKDGGYENGYLKLERCWQAGDTITINMEMPVMTVAASPQMVDNVDRRCIQRGPLVYCAEATDNGGELAGVSLFVNEQFELIAWPQFLPGAKAVLVHQDSQTTPLHLVPYFLWNNRGPGPMKVWLPYNNRGANSLYSFLLD